MGHRRIDDLVYIAGEFTEIHDEDGNTLERANLAAFDVATGVPVTWAPDGGWRSPGVGRLC